MIPKTWLQAGRQIRLKATPVNRRYGHRCASLEALDSHIFPGDQGRLAVELLRGNGWFQWRLIAEFSRGRRIVVARAELSETATSCPPADAWSWSFEVDPAEFVTRPASHIPY